MFKEAWADGENQLLVTDQPVTHDGVTTPGPVVVPVTLNANAPTTEFALGAGFDDGGSGDTHVVQRGETLWSIAQSVYGDPTAYTKIAAANGISDPNSIVTGQRLIIPGAAGAGPTPPIIVEPVRQEVVVEPVGHNAGAASTSQSVASPAPPTPADGAGSNSPVVVEPVGHGAGNGSADQPARLAGILVYCQRGQQPRPRAPAPVAAAATTSSAPLAASDVASGKGDGGGTPATSSDVPAASAAPHADPPPPARSTSDPMITNPPQSLMPRPNIRRRPHRIRMQRLHLLRPLTWPPRYHQTSRMRVARGATTVECRLERHGAEGIQW